MKKLLTLIFLSMIAFNVIHAEVTWNLSDDGTLTISGTDMPDYSRYGPWYSQNDKIKKVVIEYGVTNIGKYAFYGCSAFTSITIPESVTSIGDAAFKSCTNLTSITIPNSVTSIEGSAFEGCTSLTSITIPNSVAIIGNKAFNRTKWYNDQPDGLVYAGLVIYKYKGTMPLNTKIDIKDGTKSISEGAFYGCGRLTSITIPNSVTNIGSSAFSGCYSLTSIIIPNSVTNIGMETFYGCSGLTSVTMSNSMTSIEGDGLKHGCFQNCSSLTSITIPNSVTRIGEQAFDGCSSLTSVIMPNSVTSIERYAFRNCSSLSSVHISDLMSWCKIKFGNYDANPLYYAEHLFLNGKELNNLIVPNGITCIESCSFYNCKSITSVEIPSTVSSIGYDAFNGVKLRNIVIKAKIPPSGKDDIFSVQSYYHTTLLIPEGSWDAYAYDDSWYKFINIREMVYNAVNLTNSKAYTMKSATEGSYIFYDSVNDCVGTLSENALDDTEENNTWMTVELDGKNYVYNLGAKKFLVSDKANTSTGYSLSDTPVSIDVEDGKDAIAFGKGKEFYMVINDKLNVDEGLESQIMTSTGINEIDVESNKPTITYNLNGQRINKAHARKGIYIKNGRKYAK